MSEQKSSVGYLYLSTGLIIFLVLVYVYQVWYTKPQTETSGVFVVQTEHGPIRADYKALIIELRQIIAALERSECTSERLLKRAIAATTLFIREQELTEDLITAAHALNTDQDSSDSRTDHNDRTVNYQLTLIKSLKLIVSFLSQPLQIKSSRLNFKPLYDVLDCTRAKPQFVHEPHYKPVSFIEAFRSASMINNTVESAAELAYSNYKPAGSLIAQLKDNRSSSRPYRTCLSDNYHSGKKLTRCGLGEYKLLKNKDSGLLPPVYQYSRDQT